MKLRIVADVHAYRDPCESDYDDVADSMATLMEGLRDEDELREVIEEWYLGQWCMENGIQAETLEDLTDEQLQALWEWYVVYRTKERISDRCFDDILKGICLEVEVPDDWRPGMVLTGIEVMPAIPDNPLL